MKKKTKSWILGVSLFAIIIVIVIMVYFFTKPKISDYTQGNLQNVINAQTGYASMDVKNLRTMSLNSISASAVNKDLEALEKLYQTTKKEDILKIMIDKYVSTYNFDRAFAIMTDLYNKKSAQWEKIDPQQILYVFVNVSKFDKNIFVSILNTYKTNGQISDSDYSFYHALADAWNGDMVAMKKNIDTISDPKYEVFKNDINKNFQDSQQYKEVPEYYLKCLVGLTLLKHGYFQIAQKLAHISISQNNKYILPYQILAYSYFLSSSREDAIHSLSQMMDTDPENKNIYTFMMGVSYYWLEKYPEAILYFNQIQEDQFLTDCYRYLVLSYYNIGDYDKVSFYFQKLLAQKDIEDYDYYNYFEKVFFIPYSYGRALELFEKNPQTALGYLQSCEKTFGSKTKTVCKYGYAGLKLAKGNVDSAIKDLLYLAKTSYKSYIFQAIGEYYYKIEQYQKAKNYYVKALLSTNDQYQIQMFKKRLKDLIK